jgi:hypothetical protein
MEQQDLPGRGRLSAHTYYFNRHGSITLNVAWEGDEELQFVVCLTNHGDLACQFWIPWRVENRNLLVYSDGEAVKWGISAPPKEDHLFLSLMPSESQEIVLHARWDNDCLDFPHAAFYKVSQAGFDAEFRFAGLVSNRVTVTRSAAC